MLIELHVSRWHSGRTTLGVFSKGSRTTLWSSTVSKGKVSTVSLRWSRSTQSRRYRHCSRGRCSKFTRRSTGSRCPGIRLLCCLSRLQEQSRQEEWCAQDVAWCRSFSNVQIRRDTHTSGSWICQYECFWQALGSHQTLSACYKAIFLLICKQYCQLFVPKRCKQEEKRWLRWRMLNHERIPLDYCWFGSMLPAILLLTWFFNLNFALSPLWMHHMYSTCYLYS